MTHLLLATLIAFPGPSQHHHRHWAYPPCHHAMACFVRQARRHCLTDHDPPHCRIWHRATNAEHAFFMARVTSLPDPPKPAPPKPAPPAPAPAQPAPMSSGMTSFDSCVAYHESGGNPYAVGDGGVYFGLFQFDAATWAAATAAMGVSWPYGSASVAEQVAVFNFWSRLHPEAWPNSISACGGA